MYIEISGINVATIIGCYDYERVQNQDLIIDLHVKIYRSNWMNIDQIHTTVDYDSLCDYVKNFVPKTQYKLLESLTECLTDAILNEFPLIEEVQVAVVKPAICGVKAREVKVKFYRKRQFEVALALGSNWEFIPQQQLITAIEMLGEYVDAIKIAPIYETTPVGEVVQRNFYNTAITGYTNLKPEELLGKLKTIEKLMGKTEEVLNGPRIIDIDLILFANLVYTHNFLNVPHKSAHLRDFVLRPLADIAPNWIYPTLNKTVKELAEDLPDDESSILNQVDYYKN